MIISNAVESTARVTRRVAGANPSSHVIYLAGGSEVADGGPAVTGRRLTCACIKRSRPYLCRERSRSRSFISYAVDRSLATLTPQRASVISDDATVYVEYRL